MKNRLRKLLKLLPFIGHYFDVNVPPGHYHSPIVSKTALRPKEGKLFSHPSKEIPGIDLHEKEQLELLEIFREYYNSMPFGRQKKESLRYYFTNAFYCESDGVFLHSMLRHFKPKRIIEAGSGFSSAMMLDTNEIFADGSIRFTFIEPYPERLYGLLNENDRQNTEIIVSDLQDVPLDRFSELEENDILFIDSTHVSKTGSDVNYILFEILPSLKKGVLIHFHDVFFPFEYPQSWVMEWDGFGWNEDYILKAFLMYNPSFEIVFFNTFLEQFHTEWFRQHMPLCLENTGGSLWLRKND